MQRIQGDTLDLEAAQTMALLRGRLPRGEHAAQAAQYLKDWNGEMSADSQGAAIFQSWMRQLRKGVYGRRLRAGWNQSQSEDVLDSLVDGVALPQLRELLSGDAQGWCDQRATQPRENCDAALAAAQDRALWELYKLKGDWSMSDWRWGEVQSTVYRHTPFSQWKPMTKLFERRIGNGGSPDSVNVATYTLEKGGYTQDFGAGVRQVIALAPGRTEHWYMNSTGQSGNVMSRHYDDMIERFRNVEFLPMTGGEGGGTLTLAPAAEAAP